ncbi:hypothetical protein LJC60_03225 [Ruminococcaceae bacterium OttesenSCG-928-D13]|nr:hypothetical protein [Ruminococcaceae bacterium OttesenSCG-928-D13]
MKEWMEKHPWMVVSIIMALFLLVHDLAQRIDNIVYNIVCAGRNDRAETRGIPASCVGWPPTVDDWQAGKESRCRSITTLLAPMSGFDGEIFCFAPSDEWNGGLFLDLDYLLDMYQPFGYFSSLEQVLECI